MIAGLFEPPAALLAWFYSFTHNYIIAISMIALVIMIITAIQFWASRRWVYYEGESR